MLTAIARKAKRATRDFAWLNTIDLGPICLFSSSCVPDEHGRCAIMQTVSVGIEVPDGPRSLDVTSATERHAGELLHGRRFGGIRLIDAANSNECHYPDADSYTA